MNKAIDAKDKNLRQIMGGVQYSIDFYQRDYKWQTKQTEELVSDLTSRFLDSYKPEHVRSDVASYPSYFLGSIVLSRRADGTYIVDGQQRLTTLTLLIIYLRNLQVISMEEEDPNLQQLIQSTQYGVKNFNMAVPERKAIIEALYNGETSEGDPDDPSSANILHRYQDIETSFPEECKGRALPFFMDWLIERVQMVEISAYSDDDAYTVFETMNDRGLSLGPADMLKGYLLSSIRDSNQRTRAEEVWNNSLTALRSLSSKESENELFRSWFRGRYAQTYGGSKYDYERIGPEFHRWLRDNASRIGLNHSDAFFSFVSKRVPVYSRAYKDIQTHQIGFDSRFECLYYTGEARIDDLLLLMAPITPDDSSDLIDAKLKVVSRFLDIFIHRRVWASRNLQRPALKATFISIARELRNLDLENLTARLYAELTKPGPDDFGSPPPPLTSTTRRKIHRLLARITSYVEVEAGSGVNPYPELVVATGRSRFEIEHIWPNKFDQYSAHFQDENEFVDYRNRLGSLLLIPHDKNKSYSSMPTAEKMRFYSRSDHHLLVASLATLTYSRNPRFRGWLERSNLPFVPYDEDGFSKEGSDARLELYRSIARLIWDPARIISDSKIDPEKIISLANNLRPSLGAETQEQPRTRSFIEGRITDLIAEGLLQPGDILVGNRPDLEATAIVLPDGVIELENGDRFTAPSKAAMSLGNPGVINGWDFWVHQSSGVSLKELRARLGGTKKTNQQSLMDEEI